MPPPRAQALESEMLRRIGHLEEQIGELRELVVGKVTRMSAIAEGAEERAKRWFDSTWPAHLAEHDKLGIRVSSLENTRARGEGAVWAGRVLWVMLVGAAGLIGKLLR
jgi:hypothetical protein